MNSFCRKMEKAISALEKLDVDPWALIYYIQAKDVVQIAEEEDVTPYEVVRENLEAAIDDPNDQLQMEADSVRETLAKMGIQE